MLFVNRFVVTLLTPLFVAGICMEHCYSAGTRSRLPATLEFAVGKTISSLPQREKYFVVSCPCDFKWAPRHEGVLGEWMYSSTHSLTSALDGGGWSASRPGRFTPRERDTDSHWIGGWVGLTAGLDVISKNTIPSPHRESNPDHPIVQPEASSYTDCALSAQSFHTQMLSLRFFFVNEHNAMKAYWGSGYIAPRILDLGTRWRWVASFTARSLYPQKRAPATYWIRGWVGPRAGLDAMVKRKNSQPLPEFEPPIIKLETSRYTDWAIAARNFHSHIKQNLAL
jgi:hypothetical protein